MASASCRFTIIEHMPSVSAVIPSYNRRDLLHEALASVVDQTTPVQEIIVVDDGSTEQLCDVAIHFGARFIRQENAGAAAARNCGLRAAHSEWVAFLDSDDLWQPEKIERQWSALQQYSADLCFTDMVTFNNSGIVTRSMLRAIGEAPDNHVADVRAAYRIAKTEAHPNQIVVCRPSEFRAALARYNVVFPSTMIVRRSRALDIGGFSPELRICEDWDFVLRLSERKITALAIEVPLVRYRVHDGNWSGDYVESARMVSRMVERLLLEHPEQYPAEAQIYWQRYFPAYVMSATRVAIPAGRFGIVHELMARWSRLRPCLPVSLYLLLSVVLDSSAGSMLYRFARLLKRRVLRTRNSW